ncbi:Fe-S protein assembly co-chaperone HscB [Stenoxybacter acetivorans]|uniref:Fe-S protein assembly co-chaperone HscB n=1 Tax=Stenoxybacter acetivorans TaxID=422441 RepID=UPI00055A74AC|nr:Fe-S protein assembly co-chaperone HscB [Stenoxybacter acetivorans]
MNTYFDLFQLPAQFVLDSNVLVQHYRTLAEACHPDKFAAADAFAQKQAMMMTATINEAYRVLNDPLNRAAYLLQQAGIDADAPEHTHYPPEFLMQQMAWREALAEAGAEKDEAALMDLSAEIGAAQNDLLNELTTAFTKNDLNQAADWVRQGRFLHKLQQEIQAALP